MDFKEMSVDQLTERLAQIKAEATAENVDASIEESRAIKTELESYLTEQEGQRIYTVITFDPEAFNQIDEH